MQLRAAKTILKKLKTALKSARASTRVPEGKTPGTGYSPGMKSG